VQVKSVLIIEAQMKQYRLPFYLSLNEALRREGIRLTVAYSDPPPAEALKKDTCDLPTDFGMKVNGFWLWPKRVLFQPLLGTALRSDLVIIDEGNRFLLNHLLLLLSRLGLRRVAFWGLGVNRQVDAIRFSEWYRRCTLNWTCWWFAYTKGTARYLESQGVPGSRITAVQNSADTRGISEGVARLSSHDKLALRARLGISPLGRVGIFCGILEESKKLPFLLESSRIIKSRIPGFNLIIIGDGPQRTLVQQLGQDLPWVHLVGPKFGEEKAEFMATSDVFLLPGRVGLAVLDAFAAGLPMLTTRIPIHGPEIEYLEEGVNGLMSDPYAEAYADAVTSVLSSSELQKRLRAGAIICSEKYSIENMVANFQTGIRLCLRDSSRGKESAAALQSLSR
jgi:glycosyltransferase involved in cell wall biosynthesis